MIDQTVCRTKRTLVAIAILIAAALPTMALAQGTTAAPPELAIETADGQPTSDFHVELDPGSQTDLDLRFSARAGDPVEVVAWIADVISPPNGGFALAPQGDELHAPATWVSFAPETLTLDPGNDERRTITIAVPANTRPGQYVTAIALQTVEPAPIAGSPDVGQIVRAVAAITITVPGEFDVSFELGEPTLAQDSRGAVIQIPIENTGTTPISPEGTLTLDTPTNDNVASIPVTMGTVFAQASSAIEVPLDEPPPAGDYRLSLTLTDPDTRAADAISDRSLLIPEPVIAEGDDSAAPITFERVVIEADGVPMESVFVSMDIANIGDPVSKATITLDVSRNGQLVDSAEIAADIEIADGVTSSSTRYTPEGGFGSGLWSFRLRIDTVDEDGVTVLIAQSGTVAKIDVP